MVKLTAICICAYVWFQIKLLLCQYLDTGLSNPSASPSSGNSQLGAIDLNMHFSKRKQQRFLIYSYAQFVLYHETNKSNKELSFYTNDETSRNLIIYAIFENFFIDFVLFYFCRNQKDFLFRFDSSSMTLNDSRGDKHNFNGLERALIVEPNSRLIIEIYQPLKTFVEEIEKDLGYKQGLVPRVVCWNNSVILYYSIVELLYLEHFQEFFIIHSDHWIELSHRSQLIIFVLFVKVHLIRK